MIDDPEELTMRRRYAPKDPNATNADYDVDESEYRCCDCGGQMVSGKVVDMHQKVLVGNYRDFRTRPVISLSRRCRNCDNDISIAENARRVKKWKERNGRHSINKG